MKSKIGELNGRPLVISPYENEIKYPELLVTTEDNKIKDIKERNNGSMQSILSKSGSSNTEGGGESSNLYKSLANSIVVEDAASIYLSKDNEGYNNVYIYSRMGRNFTVTSSATPDGIFLLLIGSNDDSLMSTGLNCHSVNVFSHYGNGNLPDNTEIIVSSEDNVTPIIIDMDYVYKDPSTMNL